MSLVKLDAVKTMSSLEIAMLTGKNHSDVLRDVRKMLLDLDLGESSFAGSYLSGQNKVMPLFNLDREHTDCLLTGYSAKARMLVIKRWHELEAKQSPQPVALPTFPELLRQHADALDKLELVAPKVEHFDKYVARDGLRNLTDVAKSMGLSAVKLGRLLREHGMAFKRTDKMVWMQWFVDKGYGVTKQIIANDKDRDQAMITNTGDAYLKAQFAKDGLEGLL